MELFLQKLNIILFPSDYFHFRITSRRVNSQTIPSLIKLCLLLILPYFSFFYLKQRYGHGELENKEFRSKFGTLYTNLYPLKSTVYKMTFLFCIKRLIYGCMTVYFHDLVVANVYVYLFLPLFSIGYNLNKSPMNSKLLNSIENINESIIYSCGYFLLCYTQWICDPM